MTLLPGLFDGAQNRIKDDEFLICIFAIVLTLLSISTGSGLKMLPYPLSALSLLIALFLFRCLTTTLKQKVKLHKAKRHVERLRENGLRLRKEAIVTRMFNVLSHLNDRKVHFLFELIQNADDNEYPSGEEPKLVFHSSKQGLRLHCNEIGFTERNVDAICSAGQSSKSCPEGERQFIGKKGIGFKSVFAVAKKVWISSNAYSFRLDGDQELGPITPRWDENFPADLPLTGTSMYLHLFDAQILQDTARELSVAGPLILLFLRRIRRIEFYPPEPNDGTQKVVLKREDDLCVSHPINDQYYFSVVSEGDYKVTWLVVKHRVHFTRTIDDFPSPEKTDILLAFPRDSQLQNNMSVFNFLPIGNYGFKFIIQADFILLPNRQQIACDHPQNSAIREALSDAFLQAVHVFLKVPQLQYSWPKFLPIQPMHDNYFQGIERELYANISQDKILKAQSGQMKRPEEVFYVPRQYRDYNDQPLSQSPATADSYLSTAYPDDVWPFLELLGVRTLSFDDLVEHLRIIESSYEGICTRDAHWHAHLARALLTKRKQKESFSDLNLIPLRNNEWISAKQAKGNLFFNELPQGLEVPAGLNINIIAPEAISDADRMDLYLNFQAQPLRVNDVQDHIVFAHTAGPLSSFDVLQSHVKLLFQTQWSNRQNSTFQVFTQNQMAAPSSSVYLDHDGDFSASRYFEKGSANIHFLDSRYLEIAPEGCERLKVWLVDRLGLSIIPRLISTNHHEAVSYVSEDFHRIIENTPSSTWLLLLRENWPEYTSSIHRSRASPKKIYETLASQKVQCLNGRKHSLRETCLPLPEWQEDGGTHLPMLDIQDPNDPGWSFLHNLGVMTRPDTSFCIRWLREAKSSQCHPKDARKLYLQLQSVAKDHSNIKKDFRQYSLLYIPDTQKRWYAPDECFWSAPKSVRITPRLKSLYPECKKLFRHIIDVRDARPEDLLSEATKYNAEERRRCFLDACSLISKARLSRENRSQLKVFPICYLNGSLSFRSASPQEVWFIADCEYLRRAFNGRAPLLDFDIPDIRQMEALIEYFGLQDRRLSIEAFSDAICGGSSAIDHTATRELRQKIPNLLSVFREEKAVSEEKIQALNTIEVHEADRVDMIWKVVHQSRVFKSDLQGAGGYLRNLEGNLTIFLERESIKHNHFPFQISRKLADFGDLQDPECLDTINLILSHPDTTFVRETMARRGYNRQEPLPSSTRDNHILEHAKDTGTSEARQADPIAYSPIVTQDPTHEAAGQRRPKKSAKRSGKQDSQRSSSQNGDLPRSLMDVHKRQEYSQRETVENPRSVPNISIHSLIERRYYVDNHNYFIVDPGIPDNSLRDLYRDATSVRTDVAEVVFLSDSDSAAVYRNRIRSTESLPARISADSEGALTAFANIKSKAQTEATFYGELLLSQLLRQMQGSKYCPNDHWTSSARGTAGYTNFALKHKPSATFEISEPSNDLKEFLGSYVTSKSSSLIESATKIYIDVQTTLKDASEPLELVPYRMEKARQVSMNSHSDGALYMILRMANITRGCPQMCIIMDPWAQHVAGHLRLFSDDDMQNIIPSPFLVETAPCPTLHLDLPYSHQPLKSPRSIRLVKLERNMRDNMTIAGGLEEISLDGPHVGYACLSYTWGSNLKPFKLEIKGSGLTASLYYALVQIIQNRKAPVILWIDAVSINQEDEEEKASQIEMLHQVFSNASEIIGWIGKDSCDSELAINTISKLARGDLSALDPKHDLKKCAAFNALLARSWFRRTWIVQEVVFARELTLLCGPRKIDWASFQQGVAAYTMLAKDCISNLHIPGIRHTKNIWSLDSERQSFLSKASARPGLLSLFDSFQHTESSLMCDKLFALRALSKEACNPSFRPNYQLSLSEVLHRYAIAFVEQGDTLQMLHRAGRSSEPSEPANEPPSWVPQWTSSPYPQTITSWKSEDNRIPSLPPRPIRKPYICSTNSRILLVKGHFIDSVTTVGKHDSDSGSILKYLEEIFTIIKRSNNGSSHGLTEGHGNDLIWKLAIGHAATLPEGKWTVPNYRQSYLQLQEYMQNGGAHRDPESTRTLNAEEGQFRKRALWLYVSTAILFANRLRRARVARTNRGSVGLVPSAAHPEDKVFLVAGDIIPIIIRKNTDTGLFWMLGECYLPGAAQIVRENNNCYPSLQEIGLY